MEKEITSSILRNRGDKINTFVDNSYINKGYFKSYLTNNENESLRENLL